MNFFYEQKHYERSIRILTEKFKLFSYPAHWHLEHEIVAVFSGSLNVGFNLQTYSLSAGELIFIPGGNIHYFEAKNIGDGCYMMFSPTILNEELNGFSFPLLIKNNNNIDFFIGLFQNISDEIQKCSTAYADFINSYLRLISAWFIRIRTTDNIISSKSINTADLDKIKNLLEYIENNYAQKITVSAGANILHFSESYFSKYFKIFTGTTFSKYINYIRIKAAWDMLKTTNAKITVIADNCGFENIRTFNREFKALTGITAKEYRQNEKFI
ncbi:MAG: AraC family transcriptional regulator [Oscillospiraceae bacterium]|nr:AraC family transcriptional regulator [Oscillospiraceae bacterium]